MVRQVRHRRGSVLFLIALALDGIGADQRQSELVMLRRAGLVRERLAALICVERCLQVRSLVQLGLASRGRIFAVPHTNFEQRGATRPLDVLVTHPRLQRRSHGVQAVICRFSLAVLAQYPIEEGTPQRAARLRRCIFDLHLRLGFLLGRLLDS